ncbi:MAG: aminoglycoside phosphotransferase family protein [Alphaproteobacteria bacterium]
MRPDRHGIDLLLLHRRLVRLASFADLMPDELTPLPAAGITNLHVRLGARGLVARIPLVCFHSMAPAMNLDYQATSFRRAGASGRVPRLRALIRPARGLPLGCLVVEEVQGRPAHAIDDLPAIADTLAAIHALPMPPPEGYRPLIAIRNPVQHLARTACDAWAGIPSRWLDPSAAAQVREEIGWARNVAAAADPATQPRRLIATDPHAGNFVVDASGRAILIDLDQCYYGAPMVDLARASMPVADSWDPAAPFGAPASAILAFERAWAAAVPADLAAAARPWLRPVRRLVWLMHLGHGARAWLSPDGPAGPAATVFDPVRQAAMRAAVRFRVRPESVARMRRQWLGPGALPDP